MTKSIKKRTLDRFYNQMFYKGIEEIDEKGLKRSAVIFAPHPDDETLACGGTIMKKKKTGATIKIVFMTDGSLSHRHLIKEYKLKEIRKQEAIEANRKLGIEAQNLIFLDFKDGELYQNQYQAVSKIVEILKYQKPDEIFIPYRREKHADHYCTYKFVSSAIQKYGRKTMVYEYPVWFWNHWPLVSTPRNFSIFNFLWNSFISWIMILKDFHCSVNIKDVLPLKSEALKEYKSQMTRLLPDPHWITLGDISNGAFLERFLQNYELFYRYKQ